MNKDIFHKKQSLLFKAKKRVENITSSAKICDLNNLHDLTYRIDDRIKDLQSDFYDWHFDTFGFNVY